MTNTAQVDRFWLPDGASLALGDDGFLPDSDPEAAPGWLRDARSSPQIDAIDCLILLGEPGVGKTTELEQLYARLIGSTATDDEALLVDLSAATLPSALRSRIVGDEWHRWRAGAGRLHFFLDALDGSPMGVRAVGELLREGFADAPWDRLSLRITCRTADHCRSLASWLHRHVGPDRFAVYQLLPLRRCDARALAAHRLPDSDGWIDSVVESGLGPLAASPLTLRMLLDIAAAGYALPASRTAVYEAACRLACREAGESRGVSRQRFATAQRIAGQVILTGRASMPETAGPVVSVASGSQLLIDASQGGLRFRDRSEAEFLCARWLAWTASTAQAIDELMFADTEDGPRVVPQLREVAASLASQSPEFASRLLELDPQVLLRADPTAWGRTDPGVLVHALLRGVGSHRISRFEPFVRWRLQQFCDAALATELRRVLDDPPAGAAVREAVADIVGACRLHPLEDRLVALGHDEAAPPSVRAAAVGALSQFASDDARRSLIPLALEPPEDDLTDAIKGAALIATWPAVLPLNRLLASLSPLTAESASGAYGDFLRLHLVQALRDDQLAAALSWAAGLPRAWEAPSRGIVGVRDALLIRSAVHLHDAGILDGYASVVAHVVGEREDLVSAEARARAPGLLGDETDRRRLLARLMSHHSVDPAALVTSAPAVARPGDLTWATRRHLECADPPEKQRWAELVDALLERRGGGVLDTEARELALSVGRPAVSRSGAGDAEPFPPREHGRGELGRAERRRGFDVRSKVATAIAQGADGQLDGFWATLAWIELVDRGRAGSVLTSDPRQLAGWPLVDDDVRDWVVAAAPRYLRTASAVPHDRSYDHVVSEPARAGYRALRLLREEDPRSLAALPDAIWARWAGIIVDWPRDGETEQEFNDWAIAALLKRAPESAAEFLDAALTRDVTDGRGTDTVRRFAGALTEPLERVVLKHAASRRTPWQDRAELIDFLLSEGSAAGWQRARSLVTPSGVRAKPELAVGVASRLAAHAPDAEWHRLWRLITSDDEFGRSLTPLLAAERSRPVTDRLTEPQLADLFAWVTSRFDRDSRAIAQWSDQLLETLAARGTKDAVEACDQLTTAFPELHAVHGMRAHAAEAARRPLWSPARPAQLLPIFDASIRRSPGPGAGRRLVNLSGLGLTLLLACLVVAAVAPPARPFVAFAVLFTLPGAAILTVLRVGNPLTGQSPRSGLGSLSSHAAPAGVLAVLISGGAVTACEILLAAGHVLAAEIGFAGLVLVLVNARVRMGPGGTDATAALHALGIVALARVVAIAAPLSDASATVHLLVVALSTGYAVWRLAPPVDPPIRDLVAWRPRTGGIHVLGAGLGLGVLLYGMGAPALVGPDATVGDVALALLAVAIAATVEEVLFRGILQSSLERLLGRAGVLVASALFASLYLSAGSLALILTMALTGLVFAASVVRARVLVAAVGGHILLAGGAAVVWPALFGAPHALLPGKATAPVLAVAVSVAVSLIFTMRPSAVEAARPRRI